MYIDLSSKVRFILPTTVDELNEFNKFNKLIDEISKKLNNVTTCDFSGWGRHPINITEDDKPTIGVDEDGVLGISITDDVFIGVAGVSYYNGSRWYTYDIEGLKEGEINIVELLRKANEVI